MVSCECTERHEPRRVVLTGGPGAGKTAVLELIRQYFCVHVKVVPEAAGIVFGGGFPREGTLEVRRAAQRAIFYIQRELEAAADSGNPAILLCDRGTVDGSAYWPGPEELWSSVGTTLQEQLGRYAAVVQLHTPSVEAGYNVRNPLRIESAAQAAAIDARISQVWADHPRRFEVAATPDFLDKAARALDILRNELPRCCWSHLPALRAGSQPPGDHPGAE